MGLIWSHNTFSGLWIQVELSLGPINHFTRNLPPLISIYRFNISEFFEWRNAFALAAKVSAIQYTNLNVWALHSILYKNQTRVILRVVYTLPTAYSSLRSTPKIKTIIPLTSYKYGLKFTEKNIRSFLRVPNPRPPDCNLACPTYTPQRVNSRVHPVLAMTNFVEVVRNRQLPKMHRCCAKFVRGKPSCDISFHVTFSRCIPHYLTNAQKKLVRNDQLFAIRTFQWIKEKPRKLRTLFVWSK